MDSVLDDNNNNNNIIVYCCSLIDGNHLFNIHSSSLHSRTRSGKCSAATNQVRDFFLVAYSVICLYSSLHLAFVGRLIGRLVKCLSVVCVFVLSTEE